MDPLSIVAASAGLVKTISEVASKAWLFGTQVRQARTQMFKVSSKLNSLKKALLLLTEDVQNPAITQRADIPDFIEPCQFIVCLLDESVDELKRYTWDGKKTIDAHRSSILAAQTKILHLTINTINLWIARDTNKTEDTTEKINQLFKQLPEIGEYWNRFGVHNRFRARSSILNKYLTQLSSFVDSVAGDPSQSLRLITSSIKELSFKRLQQWTLDCTEGLRALVFQQPMTDDSKVISVLRQNYEESIKQVETFYAAMPLQDTQGFQVPGLKLAIVTELLVFALQLTALTINMELELRRQPYALYFDISETAAPLLPLSMVDVLEYRIEAITDNLADAVGFFQQIAMCLEGLVPLLDLQTLSTTEKIEEQSLEAASNTKIWSQYERGFGCDWRKWQEKPLPERLETHRAVPKITKYSWFHEDETSWTKYLKAEPGFIECSLPAAGQFLDPQFSVGGKLIWLVPRPKPVPKADKSRYRANIAIVGDSYCGKTSCISTMTSHSFSKDYTATAFERYYGCVSVFEIEGHDKDEINPSIKPPPRLRAKDYDITIQIWDSSGSNSYDELRPMCYKDLDVVIYAYSIGEPLSLESIERKWMPEINHFKEVPFIIAGMKSDLRRSSIGTPEEVATSKEVSMRTGLDFAKRHGAVAFVECSAEQDLGCNDLFLAAATTAFALPFSNHEDPWDNEGSPFELRMPFKFHEKNFNTNTKMMLEID